MGKVLDQEFDKPISNAVVQVQCQYFWGSPDQSYEGCQMKQLETDHKGCYKLYFKKGAFLEFIVKAKGYKNQVLGEQVNSSKIEVTINLK